MKGDAYLEPYIEDVIISWPNRKVCRGLISDVCLGHSEAKGDVCDVCLSSQG